MEGYRGLTNFIAELRQCRTAESERDRVEKELGNVRAKFSDTRLSSYDRKKYVWKLMYIFTMGYEVDFGLDEVLNLMATPTLPEKLVGYTSAGVLLTASASAEVLPSIVRCLRADLGSPDFNTQALALSLIGSLGGQVLASEVGDDVRRVLFSRSTFPAVRKKAALALLRLYRAKPSLVEPSSHNKQLVALLNVEDFGCRQAIIALILGVISSKGAQGLLGVLPKAAQLLLPVATRRGGYPHDQVYHKVPCPWYCVRLLRILKHFPCPTDSTIQSQIRTSLNSILTSTKLDSNVNHNNAEHCVLFEAINVIIRWGEKGDKVLRDQSALHLARFVNIREPNIRYLGLEAMTRLSKLSGTRAVIRKQQKAVFISLKEADISLRRRALDLLFAMCDKDNAVSLVAELLKYLAVAEVSIKAEMVLKLAILSERYAPDMRWYVDTILSLISHAGDYVSDEIWHRAVQIITNRKELQRYAAHKMMRAVESSEAHTTVVKVSGYILGEFGYILAEEPTEEDIEEEEKARVTAAERKKASDKSAGNKDKKGKGKSESKEEKKEETDEEEEDEEPSTVVIDAVTQFSALHKHFERQTPSTRAMLLTAYAKFFNVFPGLRPAIEQVFKDCSDSLDAEVQQRAVEYLSMLPALGADDMEKVLDVMPAFPERESLLEQLLKKSKEEAKDQDEWSKDAKGASHDVGEEEGGGAATGGAADEAVDPPGEGEGAGAASGDTEEEEEDEEEEEEEDEEDLLGGGEEGAAKGGAATASDSDDFGAGGDSEEVRMTKAQHAEAASNFAKLMSKSKGVLFQDDSVQVGVQVAVEEGAGEGALRLFVGNKSEGDLQDFSVQAEGLPELEVGESEGFPGAVAARKQARGQVSVRCMAPFTSAGKLRLTFRSDGGRKHHVYPLPLPVVASHFCKPLSMDMPTYKKRWPMFTGDKAAAETVEAVGPTSELAAATCEGLRMAVIMTVPAAVAAACTLRTDADAAGGGKKVAVGALVRIMVKEGGYQVEARAQDGALSRALVRILRLQLRQ